MTTPIERAWRDLPAQLQAHPGIKALHRAALAAQPVPDAVPVAWTRQDVVDWFNAPGRGARARLTTTLSKERDTDKPVPLYAAAHPQQPAPLTDDEIWRVGMKWAKTDGWADFERNDFIGCVREILGGITATPAPTAGADNGAANRTP